MSPPTLLFFTYYRTWPVGQMGVFKRCMRLVDRLVDTHEIHLVNFGPLPERDALFARLADRLRVHDVQGDGLGLALAGLLEELRPDGVVFGETPLRGSMRLAHRVCRAAGLRQVGIENYYGSFMEWYQRQEWPGMDGWLLLGLHPDAEAVASGERWRLAPPLVWPGDEPDTGRRVCVLGYDDRTLLTARALLERLPDSLRADVVVSPETAGLLDAPAFRRLAARVDRHLLPADRDLCRLMARARLVVGKAGFQQIVEAICLGSPIVCRAAGGGVSPGLVPPYLRRLVRIVDSAEEVVGVMPEVAAWLLEPPPNPWVAALGAVPDPVGFAADSLLELLDVPASALPRRAPAPAAG